MAIPIVNLATSITCPHGAKVNPVCTNTRVLIGGSPALLATDQYMVAGCPFQIPVGPAMKPSPCLTVRWMTFSLRVKVMGKPVLLQSSVGLCQSPEGLPQGPPIIAGAPPRVGGM